MHTILDYINWRGDLTFRQSPFNKLDSLILSCLSYLPFDHLHKNKPLSIKQLGELFFKHHDATHRDIVLPLSIDLLKAMMLSKRFGKLLTAHYVNHIDSDKETQFSALCIHLDRQTTYVAYRGTDNTLIGWKEDFNMAFSPHVPSQQYAREYLLTHSAHFKQHLIIGGHSKGGNLAIYASVFAPQHIQERILQIYNFDGPGFISAELLNNTAYDALAEKIQSFVPETAIVGMLMTHKTPYLVVKSQGKGFVQHDPFNWSVSQTDFVYTDHVDPFSQRIQHASQTLLNKLNTEQREQLVSLLFSFFSANNIYHVKDLSKLSLKIGALLKHYHDLSDEDKKIITSAFITVVNTLRAKN